MARKVRVRRKIQNIQQQMLLDVGEPIVPPRAMNNDNTFRNGFSDAIGFGGQSGFPGGPAFQQVESSTTLFENLRWYLVSNFRQLLSQLFVEIGLVQTIVCVPVDDGLRGGVLIKSKQLDEDQIKELQVSMDRDGDLETAGWASKWERLYGGAGILILVGDQDPEEPLDIKAIKKDTELEFRAADMWELFWDKQNTDGYDPELQTHNFEDYSYYSEKVHKSRVMRLKGLMAPSFVRPRLRGWGFSVVEALVRSMNQYLKATDLGFEVLDEFKVDVYKIKNMVNTLLSPNGTQKVKERVQLANWQKSYQNAVVMDSEDEFDHKQLSFAGLAEAMDGIRLQVAADMRMPITKLFGTSVSKGFATDQNDMENYNSMVESEVRGKIKYHILRMLEIKCQKMFGFIPEDLEIEFKPLRELSAVDQETVKTQKYTRILQAFQAGTISNLEYRDACNKGNIFDIQLDTTDDGLNPNDPGIDDVATEEKDRNPEDNPKDDDDPGTDRSDTRKVHLSQEPNSPAAKNTIKPYTHFQLAKRVQNSARFDKASYEADGGDGWINPQKKEIFSNPMGVDKGLWQKSKEASQAALGKEVWQFVVWFYQKQGGKFE